MLQALELLRQLGYSRGMKDRRYGRPEEIHEALTRFLEKMGRPEQALLTRLWQHWPMVMGPELAELAWPLGHTKGILLVGGEDAMAIQELSLMSGEILDRANAFMGQPFFTAVKTRLSLGKTPLDMASCTSRQKPPVLEMGPPLSGIYLQDMDQDSAVARCYARYVQKKAALHKL